MNPAPPHYDRLARWYRGLEWLAFGSALERARYIHLPLVGEGARVLMIGEGDGRALARLLAVNPSATIDYVDASAAMCDRARRRVPPPDRGRVTLRRADVWEMPLEAESFDAVTTLFFLDTLDAADVERLVPRIGSALKPGGLWLWADFVQPDRGLARWRAAAWLGILFAFFGRTTGQIARRLPPAEEAICAAGFAPVASREFQGGIVRATASRRRQPTPLLNR